MTRDELLALRRECPACCGIGEVTRTWSQHADGTCLCTGTPCPICAGTGHVLPATEEVLAMAGDPITEQATVAWVPQSTQTTGDDWTQPMVDASNSSNPSEEHVGKHLLTGGLRPEDVEPDPQAIMAERDQLLAALEQERRAVDVLAEHIEIACDGFAHGSMGAMEVAPGGYTDAAEIAAWARNRAREQAREQAREEGGE